MAGITKTKIKSHGVEVLLSRHKEVRKLKRNHSPCFHGNKFWASSWLLMDHIRRRGIPNRAKILEIGCGWGLAGIYCAKKNGAKVTAVDIDPDVFPFLHLHATINKVKITTLRRDFSKLTIRDLKDFDALIGVEICFLDEMIDPLKRLIRRALRSGVKLVLVADPGRSPFEEIGRYFVQERDGKMLDWTAQRPRRIQGRILRIKNC
jgi:predicted nicotinamide N-methyase